MASFNVLSWNLFGENKKRLKSQDRGLCDENLKPGPPEYEASVVSSLPRRSILALSNYGEAVIVCINLLLPVGRGS